MQQFKDQNFMNIFETPTETQTDYAKSHLQQKVTASANILNLKKGNYLLRYISLEKQTVSETTDKGLDFPFVQITALPGNEDKVLILEKNNSCQTWLKQPQDIALFKIDADAADIAVTIYSPIEWQTSGVNLELKHLDGKEAQPSNHQHSNLPGIIITTHIQNSGNVQFQPGQWAGRTNSRKRLEGFILEIPELGTSAIEYKVVSIDGRETAWITSPAFCGTRGRGLPLSAFAVRLKAPYYQQYDIVYKGSFFEGGQTQTETNGKFCRSPLPNDPMEAIQVTLIPKQKVKEPTDFSSFV